MRSSLSLSDVARYAYAMPKGTLGNAAQARLLAAEVAKTKARWRSASRVVLVHTMGKVGSMSIYKALRDACREDVAIFHTHRLVPLDDPAALIERKSLAPRKTWFTSAALFDLLKDEPKPTSVLTVVRDPLERNISGFFQTIERYTDNGRPIVPGRHSETGPGLAAMFVERYPHNAITTWIDREIRTHFDIDLYDTPFDKDAGFSVARNAETTVTAVRFDRLETVGPDLLSQVSDRPVSQLPRRNSSAKKHSGLLFEEMKASLVLPREAEEALYSSKYATHFGFTPGRAK